MRTWTVASLGDDGLLGEVVPVQELEEHVLDEGLVEVAPAADELDAELEVEDADLGAWLDCENTMYLVVILTLFECITNFG